MSGGKTGPAPLPMPPGWPIDDWCEWLLHVERRKASTVRARRLDVARFGRAHPDPWAVDRDDVALWTFGKADETARGYTASLRSFYHWAAAERVGRPGYDPTAGIRVRVPRTEARPCPDAVWSPVEAAMRRSDPDTALMIALAARCGLRRAEIAACHSRDHEGEALRVIGKGGVSRRVMLPPQLGAEVARRRGWCFPGGCDGHLTPDAVGRRVSGALPDGWTAHTLRHRFATELYSATRDIVRVQHALGHASIATTQRYIALRNPDYTTLAAAFDW